ncbi:uncharacterized protein VTP21DRAFT_8844 [Calcarisporiella thermophila]|uniref:uncharacterized protein n=1 Tax=Calcarisporiella thermophila TaxID=911321 RepID=UPI003742A956
MTYPILSILILIASLFTGANSSGYMVQSKMVSREISSSNMRGDLDVVAPATGSGLQHWWRRSGSPLQPISWNGPNYFGESVGKFSGSAALIESKYNNLEVVARVDNQLMHFWREHGEWLKGPKFASGASGSPAMVPNKPGRDFELVVPLSSGGIGHYYRNDLAGNKWFGPVVFGKDFDYVNAVTLIKVNDNTPGELEVIARVGDTLHHFWYEDGGWHYDKQIATGVRGQPSLIQSSIGREGNFELVSPLQEGGLAHWYRDNKVPSKPWRGPNKFGDMRLYDDVSLIQRAENPKIFNVIARSKGITKAFSRNEERIWEPETAPNL